MSGYIGSKASVTLVDGYTQAEADAEFVQDPNGAITVSGSNVGIGVVPQAGGSTWQHVQFGGTGNLVSRISDSTVDAMFASNYYVNASNVDSYITTGAAARMFFNDNTISFDQAASGTAGTAITWSEAMRISSSGHLLIGTSNEVGTSGTSGLRKGSTGQLILGSNSGGLYHQVLSSYYTVTTSGGSTSDATLKKNVTPLTGALERVCNLRGVNFEFKAAQKSGPDNGVQLGVIAQEVEAQYPEAVVTNSDGIKSVRYDRLVAPLIEAIKEQKAIIDALQEALAKIDDMETRLAALEGI